MFRIRSVAIFVLSTNVLAQTVADAHFHHLHLNATDPKADIEFYTTKFDAEDGSFKGLMDAIWAQKGWILVQKVASAPPSEVVSTIWHFGWGAEDMKATYQRQLDSGTRFATPITDISDIGGGPPNTGRFFYAYVLGPDGALIELNTATHHSFGHIHLLSADPVAAGEWYAKHFGVKARSSPQVHMYRDVQIGPSASFMMDNVNVIIYPMEYAISSHMPGWENRKTLEPTKGRVVDHIGVSVPSLDDAMAKLRKEGVTITDEPKSIAGGRVKFAFIEGPDKMRIEIIEGLASKD
jgi:catechol 2,3-dioxygenase-like lactoylglutathione lyase family enzyme